MRSHRIAWITNFDVILVSCFLTCCVGQQKVSTTINCVIDKGHPRDFNEELGWSDRRLGVDDNTIQGRGWSPHKNLRACLYMVG